MEEEIATEFAASIFVFLIIIYTHFTIKDMHLIINYIE
jgi:hypothetical protein